MRANQKYIEIGLIVVMALVVYLAYSFGYSNYIEKANQTEAECTTIQTRIDELNGKMAHKSEWEEGIDKADDLIDAMLVKYGPGNSAEKSIMMIVDMTKKIGCDVTTLAFTDKSLVYASENLAEPAEDEVTVDGEPAEAKPAIQLFRRNLSVSMNCGYTQLKKVMDYINGYPERMNVENFSIAYDQETGNLQSSLLVNLYEVEDENHEYVAPVIEDIELGNTNIFKSYEPEVEEELPEGEEGAVPAPTV